MQEGKRQRLVWARVDDELGEWVDEEADRSYERNVSRLVRDALRHLRAIRGFDREPAVRRAKEGTAT